MNTSNLAKNAACNAIVTLIDQGSLNASGSLQILDSNSIVLANFNFNLPSFLDAVDGVAVAYPINDTTALVDGSASYYAVLDRDLNMIYFGNVSGIDGLGDMKLIQTTFEQGLTITLTSVNFIVP